MVKCNGGHATAGESGADLDWDQTRRLMAKVLAIAVKEATGMVQCSGAMRQRAQRFLMTDWAQDWADELEAWSDLEEVRHGIVSGAYERESNNGRVD
jgi:hypothetical protein